MKNNKLKMDLPSVDDLFDNVSGKDMFNVERVIPIPSNKLVNFEGHPFIIDEESEEMYLLADSIKENGVLLPLIVREKGDGFYEIISGHRRKRASEIAGLKEVPCIVRHISREEAIIEMVDSNLQREKILPSEKAFAYKMKMEAMKKQGKRTDLEENKTTSDQVGRRLETTGKLGKENGYSQTQVKRYIRLTELTNELLKLVDDEIIAFTPAVEISYLSKDEQDVLYHIYKADEKTPSVSQAQELKRLSQAGELTASKIVDIMAKEKPNQIEKYKFNRNRIESLLPDNIYSDKQVEDFVVQCIEEQNERVKKAKFN